MSRSESVTEAEGKEPKRSAKSWLRFIRSAQKNKNRKRHIDDARAAWAEYELSGDRPDTVGGALRGFPVYWSSAKGFEPELLSRKPNVVIKKIFELQDAGVASTAELLLERLAKYHLEHGDFMEGMEAARGDFIHADKAAPQVIYESKTRKKRVSLSRGDDGLYSDDGSRYEGEAMEDEGGPYYESDELEAYDQCVYLSSLPYDEVLHTPNAKSCREIKELCIKFNMTREEVKARFILTTEEFEALPWGKRKEDGEESEKTSDDFKDYLEGWECYDLTNREVCWIVEGFAKELDCKSDDEWYGLRNFFPVPKFAIGSRPSKHLFPTPAYVHLEPVIKELHHLQERKFKLIDGLRRRALVNDSIPGLLKALNSARDNDFIGVAELDSIVEKGGLEAHILFVPVKELADCMREILELTQEFKDLFYELYGYPDILRGEGDPVETATSVKVKHSGAQNRFKYMKAQFAELGREALEMMCDLSLRVFTDSKLAQVMGLEHIEPFHQQNFVSALELLRNDEDRAIRLEFETDSTSFIDEQYQNETRFQVADTLINGVEKIAQLASQPVTQGSVALALKSLLSVLSGFRGGKDFENDLRVWGEQLLQDLSAPPPEPGPDIEQMKLDLVAQKQNFEAQAKARELEQEDLRIQLEAEKSRANQALETYKAQTEQRINDILAMVEQSKLQIESYKAQIQDAKRQGDEQKTIAEISQQRAELEVTAAKTARELELEREKLESERRINELYAALEQQKIANEQWESKLSLIERMMEERRLAEEVRQSAISQQIQAVQMAPQQGQSLPPINIQVDATRSGKRVGRITRDDLGNSIVEVEEHEPR